MITTGTHGCVAQLNPGIVFLLEGLGRRGQGPFTKLLTNAVYTLLFLQDFISKAKQGLDGAFIQHRGTLYTLGYPRGLRTEENVMLLLLLQLHNVIPSPAAAVASLSDL